MSIFSTPKFSAASIPIIQALYSAVLLVKVYLSLMAKGVWAPSGAIKMIPTL